MKARRESVQKELVRACGPQGVLSDVHTRGAYTPTHTCSIELSAYLIENCTPFKGSVYKTVRNELILQGKYPLIVTNFPQFTNTDVLSSVHFLNS